MGENGWGLHPYAPFKSHIALGLHYMSASGVNDASSKLYYRFVVTSSKSRSIDTFT